MQHYLSPLISHKAHNYSWRDLAIYLSRDLKKNGWITIYKLLVVSPSNDIFATAPDPTESKNEIMWNIALWSKGVVETSCIRIQSALLGKPFQLLESPGKTGWGRLVISTSLFNAIVHAINNPVGWGWMISRLHVWRGVRTTPKSLLCMRVCCI